MSCPSCQIRIVRKSEVPAGTVGIDLEGVQKDNFGSALTIAYCMNPDKVKAAFQKIGLDDVTSANFPTLIKAHANGNDLKIHKVSFRDVVKNIHFTQAERDTPSCKFVLTTK